MIQFRANLQLKINKTFTANRSIKCDIQWNLISDPELVPETHFKHVFQGNISFHLTRILLIKISIGEITSFLQFLMWSLVLETNGRNKRLSLIFFCKFFKRPPLIKFETDITQKLMKIILINQNNFFTMKTFPKRWKTFFYVLVIS